MRVNVLMSIMKVLIALVIFAASFTYSHQNEVLYKAAHRYLNHTSQYIDECLKETGTPRELYEEYNHIGEVIDDPRFICFLWCICIKPGYVDDKGILNINVLSTTLEVTDKKILDDIESKCKTPTSGDKCNAVKTSILCVVDVLSGYKY